jgi:hypothetical protein
MKALLGQRAEFSSRLNHSFTLVCVTPVDRWCEWYLSISVPHIEQRVRMGHPERITADEVLAHFLCRTKAALVAQSTPCDESDILCELYKKRRLAVRSAMEQSTGSTLIEFDELRSLFPISNNRYLIDCRSTFIEAHHLESLLTKRTDSALRDALSENISPVLSCPFDRIQP